MARRTMKEILADRKVDIAEEFRRLWWMFTAKITDAFGASAENAIKSYTGIDRYHSIRDACNDYFSEFPVEIRNTLRSVGELEKACQFSFQDACLGRQAIDISDLLDLMEFVWTVLQGLLAVANKKFAAMIPAAAYLHDHMVAQMVMLLEETDYMRVDGSDYIVSIVPKDVRVLEAAKRLPRELSNKVFEYIHRNWEGDLDAKREVLREFGQYLEPQRDVLQTLNGDLSKRVFSMLNNANIRHNNVTKGDKSYHEVIAKMDAADLERVYDDTYELCLTACMLLDSKLAMSRIKDVEVQLSPRKEGDNECRV